MKEQIAEHAYRSRQPRPDDTICISDEEFYNERSHSSVRCYKKAPPTAAQTRTVMRVTQHHTPPPVTPRASLKAQQPHQQAKHVPVQPGQKRLHWLFYVGVGMVGMLVLWMIGSTALSWLQTQYDNSVYGSPRTYQMDANVGHDGISHFMVVNLHGHIIITEIHENNLAETKVYVGPVFSGNDADTMVATVSFQVLTSSNLPDMIIAVNNQRFILINTGSTFRDATSSDHISQEVN